VSITLPESFPAGSAEIIFLAKTETSAAPSGDNDDTLDQLLAWQQGLPCRQATTEEIDARIREERDAWDD
jgi:hypothetical protein